MNWLRLRAAGEVISVAEVVMGTLAHGADEACKPYEIAAEPTGIAKRPLTGSSGTGRRHPVRVTSEDRDRQTGDRHGEGSVLNNLGLALREVGRLEERSLPTRTPALSFGRRASCRCRRSAGPNVLRPPPAVTR
jgi:hypothetical protein